MIAAGTGIVLWLAIFGVPSLRSRVSEEFLNFQHGPLMYDESCGTSNINHNYIRPGLGNSVFPREDEWTTPRIKEMVSRTKGYLARDYSLSLGWNNVSRLEPLRNRLTALKVRYIIESGVLAGQILNRTLIIPSFIYARSCAFPQ